MKKKKNDFCPIKYRYLLFETYANILNDNNMQITFKTYNN